MTCRTYAGQAELLTDVYLARARESLQVILLHTPYGRRAAYGTIARLFAERAYPAPLYTPRATFGSGGQIDYDREAADGRAAADWIIKQPWSNGEIGRFGGSYLTFTQLALRLDPPAPAQGAGPRGLGRRAAGAVLPGRRPPTSSAPATGLSCRPCLCRGRPFGLVSPLRRADTRR